MFRFLISLIVIGLIIGMLRAAARAIARAFKSLFNPPGGSTSVPKETSYTDLSPYEIEDAEYEDIKGERG